MYDAIKFRLDNLEDYQIQKLIERFALFEVRKHDNKIFWHNQQNANLKQNYGIYIKIEDGKTKIELSLHKFFNLFQNKDLSNFNDFSFEDANTAFKMLENTLEIPIYNGKIYFFEYGVNVQMQNTPNSYMNDLKSISTGRNKKPFTWNVYHKQFKVYSTERHSKIRTVFVLYDKTFESIESNFDNVPENLLRIEIKHKRIEKKIFVSDLIDNVFQKDIKSKFKRSFIDYCNFEMLPIKQNFSGNQIAIFEDLQNLGFDGALNKYLIQMQHDTISRRTFNRRKKQLEFFEKTEKKPIYQEKKSTIEIKEKIMTKLSIL